MAGFVGGSQLLTAETFGFLKTSKVLTSGIAFCTRENSGLKSPR
jgi:hypothetical protein